MLLIISIIILVSLYLYTLILHNKQNHIEMFHSGCQRTNIGIPNTIFNQLLFLDKKLDKIEGVIKPQKPSEGNKYMDQLNQLQKKYDWMQKHFNTIINPNKKAQANADAEALKKIQERNKNSVANAAAMYKFKPGQGALNMNDGPESDRQAFNKMVRSDPNKKMNKSLGKMRKKAKDKKEKKQVKKVKAKGPKGIPRGQNTSVPNGPIVSDSSFGAAFA